MRDAGDVQYAKVLQDREGRSKGCGIVEFTTDEGARDAIEKLTDTELRGRKIFVREDREDGGEGGGGGGTERAPRPPRNENSNGGGRGGDRGGGGRGGGRGGGGRGDRGNNNDGDYDDRAPREPRERAPPRVESSADGVEGDDKDAPPAVEGASLFIGNLSWETGWQELKEHFATVGEVLRADVAVGRDGRKKGFGFIRYGNAEDATKAIAELNGVEYMGRPLEVRLDNKA